MILSIAAIAAIVLIALLAWGLFWVVAFAWAKGR